MAAAIGLPTMKIGSLIALPDCSLAKLNGLGHVLEQRLNYVEIT
jgi:hypothetical protein